MQPKTDRCRANPCGRVRDWCLARSSNPKHAQSGIVHFSLSAAGKPLSTGALVAKLHEIAQDGFIASDRVTLGEYLAEAICSTTGRRTNGPYKDAMAGGLTLPRGETPEFTYE